MALLTGKEQLFPLGQDSTGAPAATTFPASLIHIAGSGSRAVTAELDAVSTTTLASVTGLSVALTKGSTYSILAELPVSTNGTAGVKLAVGTSDTLTATSFSLTGNFFTASGLASVNTTTFGGGIGSTATVVLAELSGVLVVNTAGTLVVQAAQNVSTTGTAAVLANGFLQVNKIS